MTIGHLAWNVKPFLRPWPSCVRRPPQTQNTPVEAGVPRAKNLSQDYSLRELGSDRFLGDFLFRSAIISWPEGGTATAPLRTTCSAVTLDRKSTRLNSSHTVISYAVF